MRHDKTLWEKGNMRSGGGGMPPPIPPGVCALPGRVWVRDYHSSASLLRGSICVFPHIGQKSSQNPPSVTASWRRAFPLSLAMALTAEWRPNIEHGGGLNTVSQQVCQIPHQVPEHFPKTTWVTKIPVIQGFDHKAVYGRAIALLKGCTSN